MPRRRFSRRRRRRRRLRRRPRRRRMPALDPERKFSDQAGTVAPSTAGIVVFSNGISEGTQNNQRIGNRALYVSFQFKATLIRNPAQMTGFATVVRYIVLIDKRPNQTLLAIADLFALPGAPIESPYNLHNNNRFRILADRRCVLTEVTPSKTVTFYKGMRLKTTYVGPNGAIGDTTQGALYVVWLSDIPGLVEPNINVTTRVRWVG